MHIPEHRHSGPTGSEHISPVGVRLAEEHMLVSGSVESKVESSHA